MKCPKCGTTVKDDAKFCFACGAKLEQPKALAEPEKIEVQHVKMKPEAPKAKKKGNNKKVGKIVVAVGVCAAVVVVGVNIVPRLTQTDNPCVYLSDGSYNLLTKMKKDSGVDFADGVSTAVFENSPYTIKGRTQFSPSGKYLYFYNNYDGNGGTLCRIRWDKIKKNSSGSRDALYDKVYRDDVLIEAWKRVKANKGSSGVDGIRIEDIEKMGIEKYLKELKKELIEGKYIPSPVKRVMIPKPDGSERPLGIPTVRDRIVQMAAKIAIEPVFEADFRECSYGFRPKRSAKQALEVVRKACNNKGYYVVDADIEKFFDNVNQDKLMILIEQRISDRRILKLIRQWMRSGILYGSILTISELGTSQGSVISPLLANIYLNTLDRLWEKYGRTHGILVRYADDTVIICKNKKSVNHAQSLLQYIMGKLDLRLHPVKTKIVNMWDGTE